MRFQGMIAIQWLLWFGATLRIFPMLLLTWVIFLSGCTENTQRKQKDLSDQTLLNVASQFNLDRGFHLIEGIPVYLDENAGAGKILRRLTDADATTFMAIEQPKDARALYAVDAKRVYVAELYHVQKLLNADGSSFELLTPNSGAFSRDSQHVFFFGVALEGADPNSFQVLNYPFGKDSQNAYAGTIPIPTKDVNSWEPLQEGSAEDPWYRSHRNTHPRAHRKLYASGWSRDSTGLYYGRKPFPRADKATFVVLSKYYSKDKNHVYHGDQIVDNADPMTFQVLDGPYYKGTKIHIGFGPDSTDSQRQYRSGKVYKKR
ncbi:MAG: hypothetical protein GXP24_12565 [Planctomycetes bacterium]|nr:hypothetical protein [Planctomycetota bacterium]